MKAVNKILNILVMVFGLASIVLFFTKFVTVTSGGATIDAVGAQLAFGSKVKDSLGNTHDLARSAHIFFCFILTAIAALLSFFSFKSKKLRYAVPAIALFDAIYMFAILLQNGRIDSRPFNTVNANEQIAIFYYLTAICIAVFAILAIAYLLLDDYLEVLASKGEKLSIRKRVIRFFRDYKSEVKKIVWPGFKDVARNTFVVLVMCLLVGALIWVADFGLGQLLNLILGLK